MGYYINPPDMTKEEWLNRNAVPLPTELPQTVEPPTGIELICLVENIMFSAAGIVVDDRELQAFTNPKDFRPKRWFLADTDVVRKVSPEFDRYILENRS